MTESERAADAPLDLKSDEGLHDACRRAAAAMDPERIQTLADYLKRVHDTPAEERSSLAFHHLVWLDETIGGTGRGPDLEATIQDEGFRAWFADQLGPLLNAPHPRLEQRASSLRTLFTGVRKRVVTMSKKKPRHTVLRGLAALFPHEMTGLYEQTLQDLAKSMGVSQAWGVPMHHRIVARCNSVLGPVDRDDWAAVARRLELPAQLLETDSPPSPQPPSARRYWLLALGKASHRWDSCRQQEVATLDYSSAGDLGKYATREEIPLKSNGSLACWQFSRDMKPGDIVIVKLGAKRVLGHGIVKSDYRFEPERSKHRHVRDVKWRSDLGPDGVEMDFDPIGSTQFAQKTLTEITDDVMRREILRLFDMRPPTPRSLVAPSLPEIRGFFGGLRRQKPKPLSFPAGLVETLHTGLWTHERRHFAVLTGLSGSGKTRLAIEYAKAIIGDADEARVTIQVRPGWHDAADLLGHVNPIGEKEYIRTPFLKLVLRALERPSAPHVAILDEMNLSHVEQYLAPLLSAMETGDPIELHDSAEMSGVPGRVPYPANLVLIGTVNMDETTVGISDKVLDRAFTLEFWDIEVAQWAGWAGCGLADDDRDAVQSALEDLMKALKPARLHFGWRVIREVVRFVKRSLSDEIARNTALDRVIYAKVLPKLRGDDSERFRKALKDCRTAVEDHKLTRCEAKLKDMKSDLAETGSVRFWR